VLNKPKAICQRRTGAHYVMEEIETQLRRQSLDHYVKTRSFSWLILGFVYLNWALSVFCLKKGPTFSLSRLSLKLLLLIEDELVFSMIKVNTGIYKPFVIPDKEGSSLSYSCPSRRSQTQNKNDSAWRRT
jgi:hypothetical protein